MHRCRQYKKQKNSKKTKKAADKSHDKRMSK